MSNEVELLEHRYKPFNAREIDSVLAVMHNDVIWAKGMEGGHVHLQNGVRSYWTRQQAMIDPYIGPVGFSNGPEGEAIVELHQIVHNLDGNLLADKMVGHVFRIENRLVKRFDIRATQTRQVRRDQRARELAIETANPIRSTLGVFSAILNHWQTWTFVDF